jgi:hypothetical protein
MPFSLMRTSPEIVDTLELSGERQVLMDVCPNFWTSWPTKDG